MPLERRAEDVTIGELARGQARMEKALADGLAEVKAQISGLAFVRQDVWSAEKKRMEDAFETKVSGVAIDLAAVRENLRWVTRALVGAVISGVGVYILAAVR